MNCVVEAFVAGSEIPMGNRVSSSISSVHGTVQTMLEIRRLRHEADKGDAKAQVRYGIALREGKGVSENKSEAVRYFKLAADQGDPSGQYGYGSCLETGCGITRDIQEAAKFIKLSADQSYPAALSRYGRYLFNGFGIEQDVNEAVKYFQISVEDYPWSKLHLGLCLENGFGIAQDIPKALQYHDELTDMPFRSFKRSEAGRPMCEMIVDVDQYMIKKVLGNGLSDVCEKNGELFFIKRYKVEECFDSLFMMHFLDIILRIRHPCLMQYWGWEQTRKEWRIVSDYHGNGSLADIFRKIQCEKGEIDSLLPRELVSNTIVCMVVGMNYLHQKGIIHGHLKPSNILFDENGDPVISEVCKNRFKQMGAIQHRDPKRMRYLPETTERRSPMVATKEDDVYAFGMIVRDMLHVRDDWEICLDMKGCCIHELIRERSPYPVLGELVEGCLKKDAKQRPTFEALERRIGREYEYKLYPDIPWEIARRYVLRLCTISDVIQEMKLNEFPEDSQSK
jgi:hypothetical protein